MRTLLRCAIFAYFLSGPAHAMDVTVHATDDNTAVITMTGQVDYNDVDKLRPYSGYHRVFLVLNSPQGGSTFGGLRVGQFAWDHNWTTIVKDYNDCVSACGLMWLGGKDRWVAPHGRVGLHGSYDPKTHTQSIEGEIMVSSYMARLGYSDLAIQAMLSLQMDDMVWIDPAKNVYVADIPYNVNTVPEPAQEPAKIVEYQPPAVVEPRTSGGSSFPDPKRVHAIRVDRNGRVTMAAGYSLGKPLALAGAVPPSKHENELCSMASRNCQN